MIASSGPSLGNELSAWDALSDEALKTVDAMTEPKPVYFTSSTHPTATWDDSSIDTRLEQLEAGLQALSRRLAELERQVRTGLADAGQRLSRLEYVVNELDDERSKTDF